MKMKKFIAVLSVVGMVAAMAAGCGGNSDSKSSADASGSASDWDSSTDITIVSREDGSGTRGAFIELFGVEEKNDAGEKVDMTTEEAQRQLLITLRAEITKYLVRSMLQPRRDRTMK